MSEKPSFAEIFDAMAQLLSAGLLEETESGVYLTPRGRSMASKVIEAQKIMKSSEDEVEGLLIIEDLERSNASLKLTKGKR